MSTVNEENMVASKSAAGDTNQSSAKTFEGKVVSVTGSKLVMTNKEGKEFIYWLAMDAKLTCDGSACHAEELLVGSKIRVTTRKVDRNVATDIESLNKHSEFAHSEFAQCS